MVEEWARDGGVLLMGYEMYRLLSLKKSYAAGRKKKSKKAMGPVVIDVDEEDRQQELLKGGGDKVGEGGSQRSASQSVTEVVLSPPRDRESLSQARSRCGDL